MSNFRQVLITDFIYLKAKWTSTPRPVRQKKFMYEPHTIDKTKKVWVVVTSMAKKKPPGVPGAKHSHIRNRRTKRRGKRTAVKKVYTKI
jgi:hypothetical protein